MVVIDPELAEAFWEVFIEFLKVILPILLSFLLAN